MSAIIKKTKNPKKLDSNTIGNNEVISYDNDPFFVKKDKEAAKILKKVGLPHQITTSL